MARALIAHQIDPFSAAAAPSAGVVSGAPRVILRTEGAMVLAASAFAYFRIEGGWLMFALLFLAPDVFMVGYLGGRKLGAAVYNAGHAYILPASLAACGLFLSRPAAVALGLIWIAHIGFDRMLGYGLKYQTGFRRSHLSPG